jgi:uncharacterized repeat protein (TIGR03899 family)
MEMKVNDILGLGKILPIDKLIDVISSVTGRLSKPYFDRKDIDTKAYEIKKLSEARALAKADEMKIISQAINDNFAITGGIEYNESGVVITSPKELTNQNAYIELSTPTLEERTQSRLNHREAQKQLNLESVTAYAAEQLKNEQPVTDEPIDEDWKTRFFNIAEEVSNDEMQALWGRILAGEIVKPKSYSLRTLELLRNLSKEEAECFIKFGQLAITSNTASFILNFKNEKLLEEKYQLNFGDRLLLEELGLLTANDLQFLVQETKEQKGKSVFTIGNVCVVEKEENIPQQKIQVLVFTKIGQQLLQLIETKPDLDYIQLLASKIRRKGVNVKYANILEIKDGQIHHTGLQDVPLTEIEIKQEVNRQKREEEKLKRQEEQKKKLEERNKPK